MRLTIKTDNEDESTIKSTMRYTFCAPGAIGKGRGRGIRYLITKGKTLNKSSLSSVYQPNDLVKQYIQEAETSSYNCIFVLEGSFGKERGKELTGSTMCSGQVMGTMMRKNSMVRENEYMQVDTPFSPSTYQVKQRTKEDETRVFKNSVGSNQGMRSMSNNPLILGKENMQTNISLPPSTNKVMKPAQTVEIAVVLSNPKNVKRVKGSNKCKEVSSLEVGQKLKVTFYNNRTVGKNSNLFLRHLGKIIRDSNMCPLSVSSWSDIKKQNLDHMWAAIKGGKDGNPPNLGTIFYETRKKGNKLVEPEAIEKHAQIEEIVKAEPSLPTIEIVEKCWGPQNHSHVVCFGGGVKAKDMKEGTSSTTELLSALRST
ncbi:putative protein isoform X6 [Capsicum chacoense]